MGIIQSAVNQALGTVGTVAGIGRVAKTGEESLELQKKAEKQLAEEQAYKKLKIERAEQAAKEVLEPLEKAAGKTAEGIQNISPAVAESRAYTAEQLEKHYLDAGDYANAYKMKKQKAFFGDLYSKMIQAQKQSDQKAQQKNIQKNQTQEFQNNLMKETNAMKIREEVK